MKVEKAKKSRGGGKGAVILLIILAVIALFSLLVNFITDWMWFSEMGYVSVFLKKLKTELIIGIPLFAVLVLLIDLYLHRMKKNYFNKIVSNEVTDEKKLSVYTRIVVAIFSLIIAVYTATHLWFGSLQFGHATRVKLKDPLFHLDISFYLFKLDFLKQLNDIFIVVVLLIILMSVIYYVILLAVHSPEVFERTQTGEQQTGGNAFANFANGFMNGNRVPRPNTRLDRSNLSGLVSVASGQLTVLCVIFFLMLAVAFFLRQFDLLLSHTGVVYGAGFTDIHVRLWVLRILMVLSVAGAVSAVHFIHKHQMRKILWVPVIMLIVAGAGAGAAAVVQNLVVSPDELNKETPYLQRNIKYTQNAYDLKNVQIKKFAADENLNSDDIKNNSQTVSNIRINDYDPVKTFYNQTQSIRQYYTFNDVDVDRYDLNNKLTQTYLSVREIDENKISDTWLNRHLKYTHGYGYTMSQVNAVTSSGQPDVVVKNIPPESKVSGISIKQPRIYFGEMTNDYSLVNTKEDEFDYPDGTQNRYTRYKGSAGIRLNPFARIMFAIREKSLKLLVSTNLTSKSKIIIYRNVESRVKKIMPYLKYENDPYAVTANGRLYWIVDAYTTSTNYPYSQPYSGRTGTSNYIRNSVKVVVDAYNGTVNFYVMDKDEPIARTYQKIYPKLFKDFDQMPAALRQHIRYPNDFFEIQAKIYSRYHMSNVRVFYQDEDRWSIADEIYGTKQQEMTPNYYIVNLPGEKDAEFINSIPFTPKSKQNMTALMIARNDGKNYGKLLLYEFPKSKTVYGPMQVEAQIDQNTEISQDFSLWSSAGSQYSRGNLFVIPIKDSLLYVEPVYLEASNSAIPEVKRVIVVYGDKIAYESTLGDALQELFGDNGGADTSKSVKKNGKKNKSQMDYIREAQKAYDEGQSALKEGDWAGYGKQMDALKEALDHLK